MAAPVGCTGGRGHPWPGVAKGAGFRITVFRGATAVQPREPASTTHTAGHPGLNHAGKLGGIKPEVTSAGLAARRADDILTGEGGSGMHSVFIRFLTQEDRVRGFYELATRARVSSLPGEVYQVPIESLRLLEGQHIGYRRATDVEVKAAHDQVRNPASAVL